jgi:predicted enzyme related to lactoylglutathione lyase
MRHAISWFEVPVNDLERATAFYSTILGVDLGEIAEADDRRFAPMKPPGLREKSARGCPRVPARPSLVFPS